MAEAEKTKKVKQPTAIKRDIQNKKKYLRNKMAMSRLRTELKKFHKLAVSQDKEQLKENLPKIYSLVDKGIKKNIITKNKASRIKSRLTNRTK